MKILVRLPNWLGDMVMSVSVIHQLPALFPGAQVSVIAKKGIHELLALFPPTEHQFVFSKEEYSGLKGVWQFGKKIRATEKFDLFICLPDSFSSAMMGYATSIRQRIGYKKEGREILLTHSYKKPKGWHRVEEYSWLLKRFTGSEVNSPDVRLKHNFIKRDHLVININSEASSRRLPLSKAVEVVAAARKNFAQKIILIGSLKEQPFVEEVIAQLPSNDGIESVAGKTTLLQVAELLATAQVVLTTDSGPAHLSNALGTQTVVLFGAGNENNTAPYYKEALQTIRLGKLSCEPCTKNVCVQFGTPQCLELLDTERIMAVIQEKLNA